MNSPLVSAIMITGKTPEHERLARVAAHSFLKQTYYNKELVVVNDGPYELKIGHPRVREILVKEKKPLGALRNTGLENAKGDWVIQWDDDDYHHPHRILYQMAHRQEGHAVVLRKQLRVDIIEGRAICVDHASGIAGTILHPRKVIGRYSAKADGNEDTEFLSHFYPDVIALDNDSEMWPGPALYVRLFHDRNVQSREVVMGNKGSYSKRWSPNRDEKDYVSHLLITHYGVEIAW